MLIIVHGGQTGVDRGAHFGAVDAGLRLSGYCPRNERDENGPIPDDVAVHLRPSSGGLRERTLDNIASADAVLVVVEDAARAPYATPGTAGTIITARKRGLATLVVDASWSYAVIGEWVVANAKLGADRHRLMVAGPRASLWAAGEAVARGIVSRLHSLAC